MNLACTALAVIAVSLSVVGPVHAAPSPQDADAIAQQAYLKASDASEYDWFGWATAVSGTTVVVGSEYAPQGAGAVYVFTPDSGRWVEQVVLTASQGEHDDQFGFDVAIDGDTIVVGAPWEDSAAAGVGGDGLDNSFTDAGAAYVFRRQGGVWVEEAYLKASNPRKNDWFGTSVAVSGDTIVVGAMGEDSAATGVDGDQADDSALNAGAAYVFVRDDAGWSQQAYLKASNTGAIDAFGRSVAVTGDTIVVGATWEDSQFVGTDGVGADDFAEDSGAAYVYTREAGTWSFAAYLKASNAGVRDWFGRWVDIDEDTIVVGAPLEDGGALGVNGVPDESGVDSGAAYVFARADGAWFQQAYVKGFAKGVNDLFGSRVAVSGRLLAVGAPKEDGGDAGVGGDPTKNTVLNAGAVFVYVRTADGWHPWSYVKASNPGSHDEFGTAVGLSGELLSVTALYEASAATTIDGDQFDDSASLAGAAYAFGVGGGTWFDLGGALAGAAGKPDASATGTLAPDTLVGLHLDEAARASIALLVLSLSSAPTPFKGGVLVPGPAALPPTLVATDGSGSAALSGRWPSGLPAGTGAWIQWAVQDGVATHGVALSNALLGVTP